MYQPAHFTETDPDTLLALLRAHPLATLVRGGGERELSADLIPLEVHRTADGAWRLTGHVARANPLWRDADGQDVLVIFQGAQAYVSPGWYASKAEHGKVVPTWNYGVVQAHGRLRAIDDPAWVHALVSRLTSQHETGRPAPWHVTDAPADYIAATMRAIVGIEIDVTRLDGKFKLSQNRSAADRAGVVAGLQDDAAHARQPGAAGMAQAVRDAEGRRT